MFFFNNCHSCCCNRRNDCMRCRPEHVCDCNAHNSCHANNRDCRRCDCCRNAQNDFCRRPVCACNKCCCRKCCHGIMPLGMNGEGGDYDD